MTTQPDLTATGAQVFERSVELLPPSGGEWPGGRRNRHGTALPFGGPGLLLTNARHLIGADDSRLRVYTFDNNEYPASLVGYDLPSGVGIIRHMTVSPQGDLVIHQSSSNRIGLVRIER